VFAGRQLGGASAAFFGGAMRQWQGDYTLAFLVAGVTGLIAAGMAIMIDRRRDTDAGLPAMA